MDRSEPKLGWGHRYGYMGAGIIFGSISLLSTLLAFYLSGKQNDLKQRGRYLVLWNGLSASGVIFVYLFLNAYVGEFPCFVLLWTSYLCIVPWLMTYLARGFRLMYIYRKQTEIERTDLRGLTASCNPLLASNNAHDMDDQDPMAEADIPDLFVSKNNTNVTISCCNTQEHSNQDNSQADSSSGCHRPGNKDDGSIEQQHYRSGNGSNMAPLYLTPQPHQELASRPHPSTALTGTVHFVAASASISAGRSEGQHDSTAAPTTAAGGNSPLGANGPRSTSSMTNGEHCPNMNTMAVTGSNHQGLIITALSTTSTSNHDDSNGGSLLPPLSQESRPYVTAQTITNYTQQTMPINAPLSSSLAPSPNDSIPSNLTHSRPRSASVVSLTNVATASISPSAPAPALSEYPSVLSVLEWSGHPYVSQPPPPQSRQHQQRRQQQSPECCEIGDSRRSSDRSRPSKESSHSKKLSSDVAPSGRGSTEPLTSMNSENSSSPAVIPTTSGVIFDIGGLADAGTRGKIVRQQRHAHSLLSYTDGGTPSTDGGAGTGSGNGARGGRGIGQCSSTISSVVGPMTVTLPRKIGPGAGHLDRPADYEAIVGSLAFDEIPDSRQHEWNQSPWNRYLPFNQVTDGRLALFLVLVMIFIFILCLGMQFVKPSPVQINPTSYVCGEGLVFYPIYFAMLIFLIVGCPIICWNLWWIKDGFGIRNELLLTMAIGVPGFVLYFISPIVMKELDAGHWNHVNWLVLTFIFAHTNTVVLPLISFLRRQRPKARQPSAKSNSRLASIFRWDSYKSESPVTGEFDPGMKGSGDSVLVPYELSLHHTSSHQSITSAASPRIPLAISPSISITSMIGNFHQSKFRDDNTSVITPLPSAKLPDALHRSLSTSGSLAAGGEMVVLRQQLQKRALPPTAIPAARPTRRLKGFKGFWAYYGLDAKGELISLSDMNPRAFEYALQDSEMFEALCKFSVTVFNAENTKFLQEYEGLRKQVMEYYELVGQQGRDGRNSGVSHQRVRKLRIQDGGSLGKKMASLPPQRPMSPSTCQMEAIRQTDGALTVDTSALPATACSVDGGATATDPSGFHRKPTLEVMTSKHTRNQRSLSGSIASSLSSAFSSGGKDTTSSHGGDRGNHNVLGPEDELHNQHLHDATTSPPTSAGLSITTPEAFLRDSLSMPASPALAAQPQQPAWRNFHTSAGTATATTSRQSSNGGGGGAGSSVASTTNTLSMSPLRAGHQLTSARFKDSFQIELEEELAASMKSDLMSSSSRRGPLWHHLHHHWNHRHHHNHHATDYHHHQQHQHRQSIDRTPINSVPSAVIIQRDASSSQHRQPLQRQNTMDSVGTSGGGHMTSTESADSVRRFHFSRADSDQSSFSWFGRGNMSSTRSYHDMDLSQDSQILPLEDKDDYMGGSGAGVGVAGAGVAAMENFGPASGARRSYHAYPGKQQDEVIPSVTHEDGDFNDDRIHFRLPFQVHSQASSVGQMHARTADPATLAIETAVQSNEAVVHKMPTVITASSSTPEPPSHTEKFESNKGHNLHQVVGGQEPLSTLDLVNKDHLHQIARTAVLDQQRPHSPSALPYRTTMSRDTSSPGSSTDNLRSESLGLPPSTDEGGGGSPHHGFTRPQRGGGRTSPFLSGSSSGSATGRGGANVAVPAFPKRRSLSLNSLPVLGRSKLGLVSVGTSSSDEADSNGGGEGTGHGDMNSSLPPVTSPTTTFVVPMNTRPDSIHSAATTSRTHSPAPSVSAPFTPRLPIQPNTTTITHQTNMRREASSDRLTSAPLSSIEIRAGASTSQTALLGPADTDKDFPVPLSLSQPTVLHVAACPVDIHADIDAAQQLHDLRSRTYRQGTTDTIGSTPSNTNTVANSSAAAAVANGLNVGTTRTPIPAPLLPAYYAIFSTFILPSSPLPLNLSNDIVQELMTLFRTGACYLEMYEPVVREVQNMVYDNVWRHFVLSIQENPPIVGSLSKWKRGWKLLFGEGSGYRLGTQHRRYRRHDETSSSNSGGAGDGHPLRKIRSAASLSRRSNQASSPSSVNDGPQNSSDDDGDMDNPFGGVNGGDTSSGRNPGRRKGGGDGGCSGSGRVDVFRVAGHRFVSWKRSGRKVGDQERGDHSHSQCQPTMSVVEEEHDLGLGDGSSKQASSTRLPASPSPENASSVRRGGEQSPSEEDQQQSSPSRVNYFAVHHQPTPSVTAAMEDLQRSFGIHTSAIEMESWTVATTLPSQFQHQYVKYDTNR